MEAPVRIAFDPALPVVAAQAFTAGGKTIADGDTVDWRALGINEVELHAWWQANLVRFLPVTAKPVEPPAKQRARR